MARSFLFPLKLFGKVWTDDGKETVVQVNVEGFVLCLWKDRSVCLNVLPVVASVVLVNVGLNV